MRRYKESRGRRNRTFSRGARRTNTLNVRSSPMRGGIRL